MLGCAGMADLEARLREALDVPIVESVAAGVRLACSLGRLGLGTSKVGAYSRSCRARWRGCRSCSAGSTGRRVTRREPGLPLHRPGAGPKRSSQGPARFPRSHAQDEHGVYGPRG